MASDATTVARLALDVVASISELPAKEREKHPSIDLIRRVNELIDLGKKAAPDIEEALWPTPVEIFKSDYGWGANTSYAALSTYARQLATLLSPASGGGSGIYGSRGPR